MMSTVYNCKRLRICDHLIKRGFTPFEVVPDKRNPRFHVYRFRQTPELVAAVEESAFKHSQLWLWYIP